MKGTTAFVVANGYTDETVIGGGALKGKNCTIQSTSFDADGNSIVEFVWFLDNGTAQTTNLTVKKGVDAKQITSIVIDNTDNHVKVTLDDGTVLDAGEMPQEPIKVSADSGNALVKKADGLYVSTTGVEISAKADNIIKAETDGLYVPETDLSDYVEKEDGKSLVADEDIEQITTNKTAIEVLNGDSETAGSVDKKLADAIATLNKLEKKILDHIPTVEEAKDNVLYMVESETAGTYNQYMLIDGAIANLGSTEVDLDGYAKTEEVVLLQQQIVDKGKSLIVGDDGKVIVGNAQIDIVTEFSETPSDDKVPSEKLVSDTLTQELAKKVDIQQDIAEKGKALVVGEDGKLILGEVATDGLEVVRLTKAEYEALSEDEKNDKTKLYDVYDEESLNLTDYATKEYVDDSLVDIDEKVDNFKKIANNINYQKTTVANEVYYETATTDGYFSVTNTGQTENDVAVLHLLDEDNNRLCGMETVGGPNNYATCSIFVRKGQKVEIRTQSRKGYYRFVPCDK